MINVWTDTNVLVRFITGDPPDMARRAQRLLRRAADGELLLRIPSVVVAEVVWVLGSYYGHERNAIADAVRMLLLANGVSTDDEELVFDALRLMQEANVAYVDAYVAAIARAHGEAVATFDTDFRRLGVDLLS